MRKTYLLPKSTTSQHYRPEYIFTLLNQSNIPLDSEIFIEVKHNDHTCRVASVSSPLSLPKPASTRSHIRHPLCLPKPLPLLSPPSPPLSLYEVASMVVCWMFDGLRNNAGGYGATSERWIEEASATNLRLRR